MTLYQLDHMTPQQLYSELYSSENEKITLWGTKEEYKEFCSRPEFQAILDRFVFMEWTGGVNE